MARHSIASLGTSPKAPNHRFSHITERFDVLPAKSAKASQTRLCPAKRRLPLCDNDTYVSTAIAPNGWLAAATTLEIRLFDVESQDLAKDIKPCTSFRLKPMSKGESIRGVALSNDLLAVVTHHRLIVYEYRDNRDFESNFLEKIHINAMAALTPRCVSILQVDSSNTYQSGVAWVAVGGEGASGLKVYQYCRTLCWNTPHVFHLSLRHPQCTGIIRKVGFSELVRMNCFVVYAVTSDNCVICWKILMDPTGKPATIPLATYNANGTHLPSSHPSAITSASIFSTPSHTQYILITTNQTPGSPLLQTFIAPLGAPPSQYRPLPSRTTGRQILSASVTTSGRFIILVEKYRMRVLTLQAVYDGGLTCSEETVEWKSSLGDTARDRSAIALSAKEEEHFVSVVGVDGRGHLVSARVSAPGIGMSVAPEITWCLPVEAVELRSRGSVREIGGREVRRETRVDSAVCERESLSEEIHCIIYK